jgi:hypothetical protein
LYYEDQTTDLNIILFLLERMDERSLTKVIYEGDVGNAGRGRPRRTFLVQIGEVIEKSQGAQTK